MVQLRDFIVSGRFGPIALGCDRKAIMTAFGEAESVDSDSERKRRPPAILEYGDIEFYFDSSGDSLYMIHIDRFSGPERQPIGWGRCELDAWIVRHETARAAFEQAAQQAGLTYVVETRRELDQEWLVFPSGVQVVFGAPDDSPCVITGLAAVTLTG